MAIHEPFVRWHFIAHPPHLLLNGGFYYVSTAEGASERVAMKVEIAENHFVYRAVPNFVEEYGQQLPLGDVVEWPVRAELISWLDAIIYYSFLHHSIPGVPRCWFLKFISAPQIFGVEMIPVGLQASFPAHDELIWIILRHGSKVWPVSILNHQLINGWATFRRVHELGVGYQIILSCERQWIFNTIIFNQTGRQMIYPWSTVQHPWQMLHPIPANLRTSCLPSIIENDYGLLRFGCDYVTQHQLQLVFNDYLEGIMESFELQQLIFAVGNQSWIVEVQNNAVLESTSFAVFCTALQLQLHNYLMVAVSWDLEVRVVVFLPHSNRERIYAWF